MAKNRTNVRLKYDLIRSGFRTLGPLTPGLAGRVAERIFITPPRYQAPQREAEVLARARRTDVPAYERRGLPRLAMYTWGEGPRILMVHGWGGRAGQFYAFVEPLISAGFQVVALDFPAHGASDGKVLTVAGAGEALVTVTERLGGVHAMIAHSFGAATATFALHRGVSATRGVLIGSPIHLGDVTERFGSQLHIPPEALEVMQRRLLRRVGTSWHKTPARLTWEDVDLLRLAQRCEMPTLVVHDEDDQEVPWYEGASLASAFPRGEFASTRGLGHHRVLRDPRVIERITGFLLGPNPRTESASLANSGAAA